MKVPQWCLDRAVNTPKPGDGLWYISFILDGAIIGHYCYGKTIDRAKAGAIEFQVEEMQIDPETSRKFFYDEDYGCDVEQIGEPEL
jgi:hypothetical protein